MTFDFPGFHRGLLSVVPSGLARRFFAGTFPGVDVTKSIRHTENCYDDGRFAQKIEA
jgi:hypothetical protein